MNIEENILKKLFENVYFITGTAYAGKSTMVRLLAEKHGGSMDAAMEGNRLSISAKLPREH